tara:strand:+ start:18484 stop:18879 length:396 start_codon:yes stop_codon:yes gene_type:complete
MGLFKKSKKIKNDKYRILETYNTKRAHEEMIWKSGGGLWNTLQHAIDDVYKYDDIIENLKLTIDNKNKEIFFMEKKIVELSTNYEYKDEAIYIKINYSLLKHKIIKFFIFKYFSILINNFFYFLSLLQQTK